MLYSVFDPLIAVIISSPLLILGSLAHFLGYIKNLELGLSLFFIVYVTCSSVWDKPYFIDFCMDGIRTTAFLLFQVNYFEEYEFEIGLVSLIALIIPISSANYLQFRIFTFLIATYCFKGQLIEEIENKNKFKVLYHTKIWVIVISTPIFWLIAAAIDFSSNLKEIYNTLPSKYESLKEKLAQLSTKKETALPVNNAEKEYKNRNVLSSIANNVNDDQLYTV